MQSSSIDFLFEKINIINSNNKNTIIVENHIGSQIIDLLFFKPKKVLSAKILDKIEDVQTIEVVIIKVKVFKHYKNYFNRNIPYKITVLFNEKKISLIFFSKYTGYLEKIFPLEKEIYIKGKLELYNNNLQISHPEIIDEKILLNKKNYIKLFISRKKS